MKKAFIFPGQASQFVGMGKDLYEHFESARRIFDQANEILNFDLKKVCFEGPEEELKQTYITQPAIFVHSMAVNTLLEEKGLKPDGVAGHSLGEYSALVAAGSLTFEDGLRLVQKRGQLMHESGNKNPGTMAALIGLSAEQVYELCEKLSDKGIIQPANFNSPGQIAISGQVEVIRQALDVAREMGAKKALELVVSGAFHSPLMDDARAGLQEALEKTEFKDARVPVYSNVTGGPVTARDEIRHLLFKQLTSPVLWQKSMENMIADGFAAFYEIGPGKVLCGLLKRINRQVPCQPIGTVENVNRVGEEG
ncbi:malonyl CoA-acyl carrier protein transacylase [Caldithrix abyssi DSM 13497]|uniref:Malonyl CoA-acyl carrier protein transacylase n=1 Tax=Caldithrix abyssi DSM 13497 TaxID=880073 RepID=H1XS98_CALAY|nr:ACP S-malonyltransferase [Caldithrix abyssi]APF20204.1 (Acyl-carrier-protein) S-malonyltransferase [Caldithrix abyssi DSM 13497]EHO40262.1 malonyl CoA-acyl carrier protein transacylase [Caldithrix abyssi DSM 13497]